jgi:hypothetical protein
MELAANWHRYPNLLKKRENMSLVYKERDDPLKDGLANWRTRSETRGIGAFLLLPPIGTISVKEAR